MKIEIKGTDFHLGINGFVRSKYISKKKKMVLGRALHSIKDFTIYLIRNLFIIFFLFFGANGYASTFEEVSKSTATIVHNIGLGSGFFISDNLLATNYHVVQGAKNGIVFFVTPQKTEGAGLIVAVDPENDLAIIKTVKNNFKALRMGNSQNVKMGDDVFVIGSPEGLTGTLSKGILSAKRGDGILQITAPISSGSSGSPVFSKNFEVIGIATAVLTTGQNLNFAVSVNKLKALVRKNKITLNQKTDLKQKVVQSRNNFSKSFQSYIQKKDKTPEDMFQIGGRYHLGEGVEKDYKKAIYWYEKSASKGNVGAQFALGVLYLESKELTRRDYRKAFYWFKRSADQGYAGAQYFLGGMYYRGEGVVKDYKKALYWYKKSAKQGDANAQLFLGWMYFEGQGIREDYAKAFYWYGKAARQGDATAQFNLGGMYYRGEGVSKNYIQAYKWLILAKTQEVDSLDNLDEILYMLESQMTRKQMKEAQRLASQFKIQ
ncbi:MAG: trypsin-like peptidase domain-containing protein [Bdellovibrionales bacterium]|nr:trypsin-like peptidase domain-containing protein [Bdellovibrionales bacterium]